MEGLLLFAAGQTRPAPADLRTLQFASHYTIMRLYAEVFFGRFEGAIRRCVKSQPVENIVDRVDRPKRSLYSHRVTTADAVSV